MPERETNIDNIPREAYPYAKSTNFKDKVIYSILAAGAIGLIGYLGKKEIDRIAANRSNAKSFKDGTPATTAKLIKMAFENDGYPGTNTKELRRILREIKDQKELDKVHAEYKNQNHSDMYDDMKGELQSTEYNEMLQIMHGKPQKAGQPPTDLQYKAWAERLKAAFDKTYGFIPGTDEEAIKAVFNEIPTKQAFVNVALAYYNEYSEKLSDALKGELEFWEIDDYMKIINSKPVQ